MIETFLELNTLCKGQVNFVTGAAAMKKLIFFMVSVSVLGSLWGCSHHDDESSAKSKAYSFDKAISKGDVVYLSKVYNVEKFDRFLANLESKKADRIRITGYTDEGDPIYKDLKYNGEEISYSYDNSNDAFGGSNNGIRTDRCANVTSEDVQDGTQYTLSGCTKNDSEMSYFLLLVTKK
ncbi:DUF4362 domain-containing protein [Paenibacillus chibensis]|uniref:DUF4362 domain-containing protein n=2 Tax=Paenibacillus chibensis TaxID=59846 RepID=UPI000FD96668|nr:DUF4362 domain-containing protein [Paenibacillus chibensis]MEC0370170.1 DUF4362 domain-containing protein [Paenibacillus chibensis]